MIILPPRLVGIVLDQSILAANRVGKPRFGGGWFDDLKWFATRLVRRLISYLPDDAGTRLEAAVDAYVRCGIETAKSMVKEALASPCVDTDPSMIGVDQNHTAACHRIDDEMLAIRCGSKSVLEPTGRYRWFVPFDASDDV